MHMGWPEMPADAGMEVRVYTSCPRPLAVVELVFDGGAGRALTVIGAMPPGAIPEASVRRWSALSAICSYLLKRRFVSLRMSVDEFGKACLNCISSRPHGTAVALALTASGSRGETQ